MPADPASYPLTVDETRQATWVRQSTASHTEWTFASTHPAGTTLPPGWTCRNTTLGCTVLPLLNVNYQLQVGTDGTAPAGPDQLDIAIGHLPGAPATPISTAARAGLLRRRGDLDADDLREPRRRSLPRTLDQPGVGRRR